MKSNAEYQKYHLNVDDPSPKENACLQRHRLENMTAGDGTVSGFLHLYYN